MTKLSGWLRYCFSVACFEIHKQNDSLNFNSGVILTRPPPLNNRIYRVFIKLHEHRKYSVYYRII